MQFSIKTTNKKIQKWVENLDKYFSKEDIQMPDRHVKEWSAWLNIKSHNELPAISQLLENIVNINIHANSSK